jgi:hypothetical protein
MNPLDVLNTGRRLEIEPPSAPIRLFIVNGSALSGDFVSSSFSWTTIAFRLEEKLIVPIISALFQ